MYNENFSIDRSKDICPTCKSDYNSFSCKREEWRNKDCNCFQQNKLWKDYSIANIPNNYFTKDFSDYHFVDTEKDKQYYKDIQKYIQYIDNVYKNGASLFLFNKLQFVGKTFFAISILKEAYRKGYSIKFVPFVKIYNEIISNRDCEKFLKGINQYDFIVIDSVDKQSKKEFLTDIKLLSYFEDFIKSRFKPTIFTSSVSLDTQIDTLDIIRKSMKDRLCEIHVDSLQQYYAGNNYWDNILNQKKEIIK